MPKVAGKPRKVKTTRAVASRKPTFTCTCTGGCKGCTQELSEALYKKHAKFRVLDEATNKGNVDDLAFCGQADIQHSQHDESVSFQIAIQVTLLKKKNFSPLVLYLLSLCHWLRPFLIYPSLNCLPPCQCPLITPTYLCQLAPAIFPLHIYQIQLHNRTISLSMMPLRTLILIPDALIWIPAAKIAMLVLSCQILKVFLKILASKTCSQLSNSSEHFSLHLLMILTAKWIRTLSNS